MPNFYAGSCRSGIHDQFDYGRAPPTCFRRGILKFTHQWMLAQQRTDPGLLDAGSLAVDDTHAENPLFTASRQIILYQEGQFPGIKYPALSSRFQESFECQERIN